MEAQGIIVIADAGSTKTEWNVAASNAAAVTFETAGINPSLQKDETIERTLLEALKSMKGEQPERVFFYGAGCTRHETDRMRRIIERIFRCHAEAESDLLGAARALLGHRPGIAAILGTGSNSCLYDGERIIKQTHPLGFILGDEGSGAALGRRFIKELFRGRLPSSVLGDYPLTEGQVIDAVYRRQEPNKFLASTSYFLERHIDIPEIRQLVKEEFIDFFRNNIVTYGDGEVSFVGSIAFVFQDILRETAKEEGYEIGVISRRPMDGMIRFHVLEKEK